MNFVYESELCSFMDAVKWKGKWLIIAFYYKEFQIVLK